MKGRVVFGCGAGLVACLVGAALHLLSGAHAGAALIVEDHFTIGATPAAGQYASGDIAGQGPTIAGTSGNWIGNSSGSANAQSSGLNYSGFNSSGGSVTMSGDERTGRLLTTSYGDSSVTTVYVSFLMQFESTSTTPYRAFEMHNGGFDDAANRKVQLGLNSTDFGANVGLRLFNNAGAGFNINLGAANTSVNLFVLKFVFSTVNDADSVTVWRNPSSLGGAEASGGTSLTGFNMQLDRATFAQFTAGSSDEVAFDELRVGGAFGDVTPVPEPINLSLAVFGTAFLGCAILRRWRVRRKGGDC